MEWINLAPNHCRQRVVIELLIDCHASKHQLEQYLIQLSKTVDMKPVDGPYIYPCGELGFGGRIHWTTSGAHIYSYPPITNGTEFYLVTVDAYTCKPFSLERAVDFTKTYFNTHSIIWKEI